MLPDSVFDGDPKDHYINIINGADPEVVSRNIMDYFKKLATYELFIEQKGLESEVESFKYDNIGDIDGRVMDFIIESMANIVASHER